MADDLISNLKASSKKWAQAITREAYKNLGKKRTLIKVTSTSFEDGAGKLSIKSIGENIGQRDGEIKNVARAYEYGSGLHSKKAKRKILIKARRKWALAFFWEVATANPEKFKFDKDGRVLLGSVQHPGVRATNSGKGYLKTARDKILRTQIRKEVRPDVRKAVLGVWKRSFK